jgi:hypothetical protein
VLHEKKRRIRTLKKRIGRGASLAVDLVENYSLLKETIVIKRPELTSKAGVAWL